MYNKSEIFKKSWIYAKKFSVSFASALKFTWAEVKAEMYAENKEKQVLDAYSKLNVTGMNMNVFTVMSEGKKEIEIFRGEVKEIYNKLANLSVIDEISEKAMSIAISIISKNKTIAPSAKQIFTFFKLSKQKIGI
jgi:hypothetical protein